MMKHVLIIDDDAQICKLLSRVFTQMGHAAAFEQTLASGLSHIRANNVDVVFLDVNLPDGNGLDAIAGIRRHPSAPEIIIITANENVDGAELAMRSKAWDYISKTHSYKKFKFALNRALEYRKQKQGQATRRKIDPGGILGQSRAISLCLEKVANAADNNLPVLITGETGTGKELFSRAIHANSKRCRSEFVVIDCASLPEHLVESTLFGHEKGAFTGADTAKTGLMKMADGGTLFLDEVGELPLGIQKKFLRALQEKKFRPVGGKTEIQSDFRLICATHRDLAEMVTQGSFREDLFFRLFSLNIHLPPLKDRENDIQLIARQYLTPLQNPSGASCNMSDEFIEELQIYEWPGNVRELLNTIDLVCSEAGTGATLFPHHLPDHIRAFNIRRRINAGSTRNTSSLLPCAPDDPATEAIPPLKDHIDAVKAAYLGRLMTAAQGDIKTACQLSGLSRGHLYRLLQQYAIPPS